MRIALFSEVYWPMVSGVGVTLVRLVDALEARGHQVRVYSATYPLPPDGVDRPEAHRSPSVPLFLYPDVQPSRCNATTSRKRWRPTGKSSSATTQTGAALVPADAGKSWMRTQLGGASLIGLAACPDGSFVGIDFYRKVWSADARGGNWKSVALDKPRTPLALTCDGANRWWVAGTHATLAMSADRGATWKVTDLNEDTQSPRCNSSTTSKAWPSSNSVSWSRAPTGVPAGPSKRR